MKKFIFLILSTISVFEFACKNDEGKVKNREADSLSLINNNLYKQLSAQDSTNKMFMTAFNEIQDNLDSIKLKEKLIIESSRAEDVENKKEQIKQAIQSIYEFMARNRGAIASLSSKLKRAQMNQLQSDSIISEMQKVIERLTLQVDGKEKEIAELRSQLDKLRVDYETLTSNFKTKEEESNQKTVELNTAYYIVGTLAELKEKGIIQKEGGFIGLGKTVKVQNGLRKDQFNKIDASLTSSIPLGCKKAKVHTVHPEASFKMIGTEGISIEKLEISNSKEFWSESKFLVIEVKK